MQNIPAQNEIFVFVHNNEEAKLEEEVFWIQIQIIVKFQVQGSRFEKLGTVRMKSHELPL